MGKNICENRKARHTYAILDSFEAGIILQGTEVKSLREGRANLTDSYAAIEDGEIFLYQLHIGPYPPAADFNHEPKRTRKLLLHKQEIKRLLGKTEQKGLTIIPLRLYFKGAVAKVELGLARGKRQYDRREEIKRKDLERDEERTYKGKRIKL